MPKIRTKLLIAFLVVVLVPLIGTGLYGNWITSQIISDRAIESARNDIHLRTQQVAGFLNRVRGDVFYLSHLDSLQQLIEARALDDQEYIDYWQTQLTRDFLIFSAARPMYYQIRYLAEDGQEMVRIDSDSQTSYIIGQDDLQNKAHRYYFTQTMTLPPSSIHVSSLDLNRENGRVEVPYVPVIRYATPVFDKAVTRRGIVIINVYADYFLQELQESKTADSALIMVDQDGYYLMHPDNSRLWGRQIDLDTGWNIQADYPEYTTDILSGRDGHFRVGNRVVVYTALHPVAADQGHYWVIMRDASALALFEPVTTFRVTAVAILALAVAVAMVIALVLSRQLTAPILRLREGVERFGQGKLNHPIPIQSQDEIGQLTVTFNKMAGVINQHLDQLTTLNKAGQFISSSLDRQVILDAILQATQALFPAAYCAVTITSAELPTLISEAGDLQWTSQRETDQVQAAHQHVLKHGDWRAIRLSGMDGYLCCAPLCWGVGKTGVIELYGRHHALNDATNGNLLFTLAVEASIALENADLYEQLADHKRQLEELVAQLINAQEAERKFVAYDLHDGLIQYLVGARLHLSKLSRQCAKTADGVEPVLDEVMASLTHAVQEGRRVIEGLRPTLLDDLGLIPALDELSRDMGHVAGWDIAFENKIGNTRLPPTIELTAFRVVQEALTNVRKHAQAEQVNLKLSRENGWLKISVQDNGKGFSIPQTRGRCFGLVSMRERATLLGGSCDIVSQVGKGTAVSFRLPLSNGEKNGS